VWTGSRMIVWGGETGPLSVNTGGLYDPATDTWAATSTANAPEGRSRHTAVWTGSRMLVWGGLGNAGTGLMGGGIYDPATDTWSPMSTTSAPAGRYSHTAVWTGSRMIVWGGIVGGVASMTGGVYNPSTDTWAAISSTDAPSARWLHAAVWTGSRMIVWGGADTGLVPFPDGGSYDPAADTWSAVSATSAPVARSSHSAVWTGSKMIVWGGVGVMMGTPISSGGIYDPAADTWSTTSATNAPVARYNHTAVWAGSTMVVWAGFDGSGSLNSGAGYDPSNDSWTATSTTNPPTARNAHTGVWTGARMIVWGGNDGMAVTNTGGIYDPIGTPTPTDFYAVTPCRVFDTRALSGPTLGAPLTCGAEQSFAVAGKCAVPSSAKAVSVNLTGTGSTAPGNLRLFPAGAVTPVVSALNYVAGQTRGNNAVAALGTGGQISVLCSPSGTTHVILDVNGYFQ